MRHDRIITWALTGSVGFGLAVGTLLFWRVGFTPVLDAFSSASGGLILAYLGVSIAIALALTWKWRIILDAYDAKLPFYTLFIYRLIGFAVSYVTPTAHVGGEPVRALLLTKQGIPLKLSFATAIVDRSIEVLFNILFFFIGALIIVNMASVPLMERAFTFLLSLIILVLATVLVFHIVGKRRVLVPLCEALGATRLQRWPQWRDALNEMELLIEHFYANRKKQFFQALTVNTLLWVLMYFEYKIALLLLGYDAGVLSIFVFLTGVGIAYSIPIPAALGVLELGQVTAAALLHVSPAIALALSAIIRARDIIWTLIGITLLGAFHQNFFHLYEKSQQAARENNFAVLKLELRVLRNEQKLKRRGAE
ncbi:UPF0104 family protein [Candidatus Woesearchaeota archaeon]|nr:MAG: UPF0104 family protein [Candidatus Woesearchaeota archaeon]